MDLINGMNARYFEGSCKNRVAADPIEFELTLEFDQYDIEHFGDLPPTIVKFRNANSYAISGGIIDWIDSPIFSSDIATIKDEILKQTMTIEQRNLVENSCGRIKNIGKNTWRKNNEDIGILLSIVNPKNDSLISKIGIIQARLDLVADAFPAFVHISDLLTLRKIYNIEEFNPKASNKLKDDDPLMMLLQIIGYKSDNIREMLGSTANAYKANAFDRINDKIDNLINKPFSDFYQQERISMKFDYDGPNLYMHIKSNGCTMDISERSDGLQWYLNLYIQLRYMNLRDRNLIYLLDEPGVHLHVNAQKDILRFFDTLAENNNQIIYTTHSPFMINIDSLGSVRALDKDENGCTRIYNSVFNADLSPVNKMDTLSPIVNALGMDLKHSIGPRSDSKNIITEGISEYYYLLSMIKYFGLSSEEYCIIPANGADAIINVCSILIGWGYNFSVLYDLDSKGVSACKLITTKFGLRVNEIVHFLVDVGNNQWWEKAYYESNKCEIENFISKDILQQIRTPDESGEPIGKMIAAKRFYDGILAGTLIPDVTTKANFRKLFIRLGIGDIQYEEKTI